MAPRLLVTPNMTSLDILVVDDELSMRRLLECALETQGYRLKTAAGACEALHCLETHPLPRLILLDLGLGMTHGEDFRHRQLANPRLADVPVVLVSGAHDLTAKARVLGVETAIAKPFRLPALLGVVHGYCPHEA